MRSLDYKTLLACLLLVTRVHAQTSPEPPSQAPVPSPDVSPAPVPEEPTPSPPPPASTPVEPPEPVPAPPPAATDTAPDPDADEPGIVELEPGSHFPAKSWPQIEFKARVMTGFELQSFHPDGGQTVPDTTEAAYFLEQAVVEAAAKLSKRLELELGFNLKTRAVRDAFVNYRFDDAIEARVGHFKRPFSRLELRSRGRIPFRDRGQLNNELSDANLVGRTLGAMVHGRPLEPLRYFVAVMQPAPLESKIKGADLIGRILFDPSPAFSVGLAAQHKWSERSENGDDLELNAAGLDTKIEAGAFEVTLETEVFQNPNPPPVSSLPSSTLRTPWAFGAIGYATYRVPLSKKWDFEPVVVLEWLDPDLEYSGDDRLRAIAGLSVNFRKNLLRLMPQVVIERPTSGAGPRSEIANETYYLMVSSDL